MNNQQNGLNTPIGNNNNQSKPNQQKPVLHAKTHNNGNNSYNNKGLNHYSSVPSNQQRPFKKKGYLYSNYNTGYQSHYDGPNHYNGYHKYNTTNYNMSTKSQSKSEDFGLPFKFSNYSNLFINACVSLFT